MSATHIWQVIQTKLNTHLDAIAICASDRDLSYKMLNEEVLAYANYLRSAGVKKGDRIAILVPRDSHLIVILLGVLAVGAVYVPLNFRNPRVRNQALLIDSKSDFIISFEPYEEVCQLQPIVEILKWQMNNSEIALIDPNSLAYILYTSGSTGTPKGVMISHANTLSLLDWAQTVYSKDILAFSLASTAISFDLSVFEMFAPLLVGGCVVIVENALSLLDPSFNYPISLINTVPSAIRELIASDAIPNSVHTINLAGEALEQELVDTLYETTAVKQIYNLYGPSETTTYSTYHLMINSA